MSKTALITGTSSGFGEALVHAFSQHGWNVTATMRDPDRPPAAFAELPGVVVEQLDITDQSSIETALRRSEDRVGPIDVLLNVAGYVQFGTLEEHSIDQLRRVFETNVFGTLALTKAVLPGMRARRSGHIINFSSAAGIVAMPLIGAYGSSKAALESYSESLAYDLSHLGVQVTVVQPGKFLSDLVGKSEAPEQAVAEYEAANAHRAEIMDYTPGNMTAASEAIVSIAGAPDAPMRLYVGHGLDHVRKRYQRHLDTWTQWEQTTLQTL